MSMDSLLLLSSATFKVDGKDMNISDLIGPFSSFLVLLCPFFLKWVILVLFIS
jgi:hypothetical protein